MKKFALAVAIVKEVVGKYPYLRKVANNIINN